MRAAAHENHRNWYSHRSLSSANLNKGNSSEHNFNWQPKESSYLDATVEFQKHVEDERRDIDTLLTGLTEQIIKTGDLSLLDQIDLNLHNKIALRLINAGKEQLVCQNLNQFGYSGQSFLAYKWNLEMVTPEEIATAPVEDAIGAIDEYAGRYSLVGDNGRIPVYIEDELKTIYQNNDNYFVRLKINHYIHIPFVDATAAEKKGA